MKYSRRSVGRDRVAKLICLFNLCSSERLGFSSRKGPTFAANHGPAYTTLVSSSRRRETEPGSQEAAIGLLTARGPCRLLAGRCPPQNCLASQVPTFLPCPLANAAGFPLASNLKVDLRGW